MSSVYSTRFLGSAGLTGTGPSFVVPAGKTAVVKQLTLYCSNGALPLVAFLEDEPTGAALTEDSWGAGDQHAVSQYLGIVFEAGAGFHLQVDTAGAGTVDYSVSGFLLDA